MKKIFTLLMVAVLCAGFSLQAKPNLKALNAKNAISGLTVKSTKGLKAPAKAAVDADAVYDAFLEDWYTIFYPNYLADYFVCTADCSDEAFDYAFEVFEYCGELQEKMVAAYSAAMESGEYVSPLTEAIIDELDDYFLNLAILVFPNFWEDYVAGFAAIDALEELAEEYPEFAAYAAEAANNIDDSLYDVEEALYSAVIEAATTAYYEDYDPITGYVTPESYIAAMAEAEGIAKKVKVLAIYYEYYEQYKDILEAYGDYVNNDEFPAYALVHEEQVAAVAEQIESLGEAIKASYDKSVETGEYEGPSDEEIGVVMNAVLGLMSDIDEAYINILVGFETDYDTLDELLSLLNPILDDDDAPLDKYFAAGDIAGKIYGLLEDCRLAEYTAINETAVYVSPLNDENLGAIKAEIDALLSTDGIKAINADAQGVVYYDLNGKVVANPTAGKVYIRVANGKANKVVK